MPTHWVRLQGNNAFTTANSLVVNTTVYQNSREQSGNITLVQDVTVVAGYIWGITDTDNSWSMTLLVVDEGRVPTYSDPEINATGGSDPEVKGQFWFARGPTLYEPKRLIDIPVESEFIIRLNKEEGGQAGTIYWALGFLLNARF